VELSWTHSAIHDLTDAGNFIAEDNPKAAREAAGRVREAVEYLLDHPSLGRGGRLRGTRELVVSGTPFIIVYRIRMDTIQVLRVLHHARKWP
jgi:addiction module RelE/StbE family toxin